MDRFKTIYRKLAAPVFALAVEATELLIPPFLPTPPEFHSVNGKNI